jgi:hypothetical protein
MELLIYPIIFYVAKKIVLRRGWRQQSNVAAPLSLATAQ